MRNKAFVLLVILSFLFATTPQQGLTYLIEHQDTFKFKKFVFTDSGIEMIVPTEALGAVYSEKAKIGYTKAIVEKDGSMWKVVLIFSGEKEVKPATEKKDPPPAKTLSPEEKKTVELLKKERDSKKSKVKSKKPLEKKTEIEKEKRVSVPATPKTVKRETVKLVYLKKTSTEKGNGSSASSAVKSLAKATQLPLKREKLSSEQSPVLSSKPKKAEKAADGLPAKFQGVTKEAKKELLKPVSLSLKGVPPVAFLDLLSEKTGLSVVPVGKLPQKPITLFIENIPLYKVIDIFLAQTGMGLVVDSENVIIVGTVDAIENVKKTREVLSYLDAGLSDIQVVKLKNSKAQSVASHIMNVFGEPLKARAVSENNVIIIKGPKHMVEKAIEVIKRIDRPRPQIFIQAKIVEVSESAVDELGIRWGISSVSPAGSNGLPVTVSTSPELPPGPPSGTKDSVRLYPERTPSFAQLLKIGMPHDVFSFETALYGLVQKGKAKILSQPQVIVEEGETGRMNQIKEIPFTYTNNFMATVSFRPAGIILKVTPRIVDLKKKLIKLKIKVESSAPDFSRSVNGLPPIDRQGVETVNIIKSGEYTILGGLKVKKVTKNKKGIPLLSSIPLIKHLFTSKSSRNETYDFLVVLKAGLTGQS